MEVIKYNLSILIDSPTELSKIINVTPTQICNWKAGKSEMGIYKLKAICQYYNVSADWVLGLSDEKDTIELSRDLAEKLRNELNHKLT